LSDEEDDLPVWDAERQPPPQTRRYDNGSNQSQVTDRPLLAFPSNLGPRQNPADYDGRAAYDQWPDSKDPYYENHYKWAFLLTS
jgi:hypothetical protein